MDSGRDAEVEAISWLSWQLLKQSVGDLGEVQNVAHSVGKGLRVDEDDVQSAAVNRNGTNGSEDVGLRIVLAGEVTQLVLSRQLVHESAKVGKVEVDHVDGDLVSLVHDVVAKTGMVLCAALGTGSE